MKIGIDNRGLTGIGRYADNLIINLLKIDQKNQYVLFLRPENFKNYDPLPPNARKVLADPTYYSYREQLSLPFTIAREKLDLMHFTHFSSPYFYSGPSVVTVHDLTVYFYPGKKINSPFHQWVYRRLVKRVTTRARKIIAVSENTKKDLIKLFKIKPAKIEVTYEGAASDIYRVIEDKEAIEKIKQKYDITKPYLLYIGVWRDHKNVVGLLKAFKILRQKHKLDAQLVLTGKADPKYPEVRRTIKDLGLSKDIVLTGFAPEEDLPLLLAGARVFVFPSFYEGFGLPVLEAFACGVPVACANSSSLPEVGGRAAAYFDPGSIEEMAHVVNLTFNDRAIRAKLREEAFKQVRRFSWLRMARQTLKIYEDALR